MLALILLTTLPVLPPELSIALAAFASWFSNWLRDDNVPRQWNTLIALAAFLCCVVAAAWLTTGFSSDPRSDILLLIGLGVQFVLGSRELVDLLDYVKNAPSPLVKPTVYVNKESTPQREQVL